MMINKIIKYLSSQAIQSAIFKGLTGFFMFISISFLVRYLGETGYGIWVLVFSFFLFDLFQIKGVMQAYLIANAITFFVIDVVSNIRFGKSF